MVTYNRIDLTKQTLKAIFENTNYPYKIIFVDNGSTDGTVKFLQQHCELKKKEIDNFINYSIHCNYGNKGIAIGRNQALYLADSDWLVTLDNDVWIPSGWLTECVDILSRNRQYGAIGVNMENVHYPIVTLNEKEFQDKPRGNLGTACMVFNKSLHKMLGFFNHLDYKKYGEEDSDWGMRTRVIGLKLGYIKENGKHLGEGENDKGPYREFKTKQHKENLAKFHQNCRDYFSRKKSLYIPFNNDQ